MSGSDWPRRFAPAARDVGDALRFFTRAPLGDDPSRAAPLDINRVAWAAPLAGAAVGLVGALILALTAKLGLPALMRAGLATAALVLATGGLHEDGIADVADGFGGGATRAEKLEIMRDSRIGAYGAIALTLSLLLRVAALAAALDGGLCGAGAAAGRLNASALAAAWGSGLVIALALGLVALGVTHALVAALASGAGALAIVLIARRQIGGQTGDVAGAAQQCAEIAAWCGLLIGHSTP